MHQNAIVATCLLNNQLVFSDEFDRKDPILGFRQNSTEGRDLQTTVRPPTNQPGRLKKILWISNKETFGRSVKNQCLRTALKMRDVPFGEFI